MRTLEEMTKDYEESKRRQAIPPYTTIKKISTKEIKKAISLYPESKIHYSDWGDPIYVKIIDKSIHQIKRELRKKRRALRRRHNGRTRITLDGFESRYGNSIGPY